jgi:hypothetical protein
LIPDSSPNAIPGWPNSAVAGNFAWPSWIKLLRAWRLRRSRLLCRENADYYLRPEKSYGKMKSKEARERLHKLENGTNATGKK